MTNFAITLCLNVNTHQKWFVFEIKPHNFQKDAASVTGIYEFFNDVLLKI